MDWFVLGIEPTKDKKAITAAYRQKLRHTNPEDKPEEFKALRQAYEEALALADREETEPARDESPVGLWIREVEALYNDFPRRRDPACWRALLAGDVCIGLDTRAGAEEALLRFLMENYLLPKAVWQALDETFAFSQRVEELYETWPKDFIDNAVLSGLRLDPALDFSLYTPGISGKDCDAYSRLYFQANQTPLADIGPILEQMDALPESHPYGDGLRCRFQMATGREAEGKAGFCRLAEAYPENALLVIAWAEICLEDGDIRQAETLAEHILQAEPQYVGAKMIVARCLAARGQYHEAKECAYEIMHSNSENPMLMEQMTELMTAWNGELIREREARYAESPEDMENLVELAWCYAQNQRIEDATACAKKLNPSTTDPYEYHNLLGKIHHNTQEFELALVHLQAVETVLRGMKEATSEKDRRRKARLPEVMQLQGNCLMQLGRTAEAKERFREALAEAPENSEVLSLMGRILFASGEYEQAVEIFRQLIAVSPGAWVAELLSAVCLYRLRRDREALDAVDRALVINSSDLSMYVLKMQIFIRNGIYDQVHGLLDMLRQSGAPQDIATDFIQAELTELEKQDTKSALKQYRAIQKRMEAGEQMVLVSDFYYHLAVLTGNQLDLGREANRETVLALVDKGLAENAQDADLLAYKAWVLKKGGAQEAAMEMYRELLEKQPDSVIALRGLGDLYYEDLEQRAGEALACYEALLKTQKTPELYFYAATCRRHMGDLEGARTDYLRELEMDQEDLDAYRGLAFIADTQGDYDQSLKLLEQALGIMEEYGRQYDWMVEHKAKVLRRLGRYEEALAFAAESASRYQYADAMQLQFDICCQFGLWTRAQQVLDQWKRTDSNNPDYIAAVGRLNLLQGKLSKAAMAMGPTKHKLPERQVEEFRLQLNDLEGNHHRMIQLWTLRVRRNPEDDHGLLSLAHAYWHAGLVEAAQGAAHKALGLLDEILTRNLTDEAIYRSRRCLALAILGREAEAKEELARTRALPLCEFCEYGSCKDADIYEAQIAEIMGDDRRAAALFAAGKEKWPDDIDFAAGMARLKKKGRK